MSDNKGFDLLKKVIRNMEDIHIQIPIDDIKPEHSLIEDLAIDSLGRVGLFYDLLEEIDQDLEETLALKWNTIQDVIDFINTY